MKSMLLRGAILSLLATFAGTAQAAEEKLDWAQPFVGDWTLSGVSEGDPYCLITLGDEGTIGGATLDISATCLRRFPLEEVSGWTLRDDSIVLIDATRQPVLTLDHQTTDSYGGELADGRTVAFDRGGFDAPELDELMDGTFNLSGYNDQESCGFMVEATSPTEGTIEQSGDCPAEWKDKGWSKWQIVSDKLELLDEGGAAIVTLTREDAFTFSADGHEGLFFGTGSILVSE